MNPLKIFEIIYISIMANINFLNLTIYPHRSLSKRGFRILMLIIMVLCLSGGFIFWMLGAWPVFGFFGLDIILIYLAFKINYRSGEVYEHISLASKKFKISRGFPSGKLQVWELDPHWAKVELIKDKNQSQLFIKSENKVVSIGSFLNSFAKENLGKKINESIQRYRKTYSV